MTTQRKYRSKTVDRYVAECPDCGALVTQQITHNKWHDAQTPLIQEQQASTSDQVRAPAWSGTEPTQEFHRVRQQLASAMERHPAGSRRTIAP